VYLLPKAGSLKGVPKGTDITVFDDGPISIAFTTRSADDELNVIERFDPLVKVTYSAPSRTTVSVCRPVFGFRNVVAAGLGSVPVYVYPYFGSTD
jgi:hypothetical protein